MKIKKTIAALVVLMTAMSLSNFENLAFGAKLKMKSIAYGPNFEGYLVSPENLKTPHPGILVIHNWMGLTDETKTQANRFAQLGYIVLAADIYGKDQRPKDQKEAAAIAGKYKTDRKLYREHLNLALSRMSEEPGVDQSKLAVVGYCFGGTGAIELARSGAPILGAISFHGALDSPTPADGKNIKAKILAHHGAIDPFVPDQDVAAFEAEMKANKIDYQLIKYGNTVHSFTDKGAGDDISKGQAYNAASDRRSFQATDDFLKEIFK